MKEEIRKYVKQADETFWAQNEAGCTYDTEKIEFQNLMALSVQDRADALKEGVALVYVDPNDSATIKKVVRAPYIARFSWYLIPLMQSLKEAEQEDLLTMPAFEYVPPGLKGKPLCEKRKIICRKLFPKSQTMNRKRFYITMVKMNLSSIGVPKSFWTAFGLLK